MNFYQFLKKLQTEIGCDCEVSIKLWDFMGVVEGIGVNIDWPNDFHYRFVVPEPMLDNAGGLEFLCKHIIHDAKKKYRIAEVGED